jgi:hypothetical protein
MVEVVSVWDGEHFVPLKRFAKLCDAQFIIGERYIVEVGWQQSAAKRAAFHATLADIFASLPDDIASKYLSVEHFRKTLTIKAGFATQQDEICASRAEALRLAAIVRGREPYSVVEVSGNIVRIWTALSTAGHAMDGKKFSECVDAVFGLASDMVGVDAKTLKKHAKDKLSAPQLGPENDAPTAASSERVAASPSAARDQLTRDLAISALPDTPGIEAAEGGILCTWLRGSVVDFLDEATSIVMAGKNALRAIGYDGRTVFFKIGEAK